jgi:lysophospholipase L1-like esterase
MKIGFKPKKLLLPLCLPIACALLVGCKTLPPNSLAGHDSSKWQNDMAAFAAIDVTNPPPKGCILFVGSSSIRLWKSLQQDYPDLPVVNRGFGGSQIADAYNFADRIIIPYKPRQIILYSGTNDINSGKDPDLVFGDLVALLTRIKRALPDTKIGVIAVAPTPSRWNQIDKQRRFNELAKAYCQRRGMDFIDVSRAMLGSDGKPLPDIFVADKLHLNQNGYAIWKKAVEPYLAR